MFKSHQLFVSKLFDGERFHRNVLVEIDNGNISSLTSNQALSNSVPCYEGLLVPGFVDLQVNGGGDLLFNQSPTVGTLQKMVSAHQKFGTTAMLPTIITDDIAVMQRGADAVAAMVKDRRSGVVGIHFEGPHISVDKRGAHNAEHIRLISDAEWKLFERSDLGVKLITVAPECISTEQIQRLTSLDVTVSIGHSNASYAQAHQAIGAGATGFTHLYNAMSPLQGREPGVVGAALLNPSSFAGIICDGHHVDFDSVRLAFQNLGASRLTLVTDAMPPVGGVKSSFDLVGNSVQLEDKRLVGEGGELAGSVLTMLDAIKNAVDGVGIELGQALQMATSTPITWIETKSKGRNGSSVNSHSARLGSIKVGSQADMLLLDVNLSILQRWRCGDCLS